MHRESILSPSESGKIRRSRQTVTRPHLAFFQRVKQNEKGENEKERKEERKGDILNYPRIETGVRKRWDILNVLFPFRSRFDTAVAGRDVTLFCDHSVW
jgi:hypothetical protein